MPSAVQQPVRASSLCADCYVWWMRLISSHLSCHRSECCDLATCIVDAQWVAARDGAVWGTVRGGQWMSSFGYVL